MFGLFKNSQVKLNSPQTENSLCQSNSNLDQLDFFKKINLDDDSLKKTPQNSSQTLTEHQKYTQILQNLQQRQQQEEEKEKELQNMNLENLLQLQNLRMSSNNLPQHSPIQQYQLTQSQIQQLVLQKLQNPEQRDISQQSHNNIVPKLEHNVQMPQTMNSKRNSFEFSINNSFYFQNSEDNKNLRQQNINYHPRTCSDTLIHPISSLACQNSYQKPYHKLSDKSNASNSTSADTLPCQQGPIFSFPQVHTQQLAFPSIQEDSQQVKKRSASQSSFYFDINSNTVKNELSTKSAHKISLGNLSDISQAQNPTIRISSPLLQISAKKESNGQGQPRKRSSQGEIYQLKSNNKYDDVCKRHGRNLYPYFGVHFYNDLNQNQQFQKDLSQLIAGINNDPILYIKQKLQGKQLKTKKEIEGIIMQKDSTINISFKLWLSKYLEITMNSTKESHNNKIRSTHEQRHKAFTQKSKQLIQVLDECI